MSCTFHPPHLDAWIYLVGCHALLVVAGGIPIAIWAYYAGRHRPRWCMLLAFVLALSIPLYLHHGPADPRDSAPPPIFWIGHFLASTFGFSTAFKLWNVAFQQYPNGSDVSLRLFVTWFVVLPEPQFVKGKTRKLSTSEIAQILLAPLQKLLALSIILSILTTQKSGIRNYENRMESMFLKIMVMLQTKEGTLLHEVWNGWIHLWWLYLYVSFLLELSVVASLLLTGFQAMDPAFRNPLLESRSLREFWGTRWNVPVHRLLQRTVYVPMREHGYTRPIAALGTFLVSGLLHEYNFWTHNFVAYQQFGEATLFFVAMGCLMLVEHWVVSNVVDNALNEFVRTIPSFVISFVYMMLTAIPVERYFIKSWLESGMIEATSLLFPHMTCR